MNRTLALIPPSGIRTFFELVAATPGVISLGVGEPDFDAPWAVREAAIYSLERGETAYTSSAGLPELRAAIASYLKRQFGARYAPENEILVTVGVSQALDLALRSLLNPGDEILIPEPAYVSYGPLSVLCRARPKAIACSAEHDWALRPDMLEDAISKKTKAVIVNYPNNPTGAVLKKKEVKAIAGIVLSHKLFLISDEIYAELSYDREHTSFSSLSELKPRLVLLHGFSKSWAMTGFRIGYAAASRELIEGMTKLHQYAMLCAPTPSQLAAVEALRSAALGQLKAMVREYDRRRRFLVRGLNGLGLACSMPGGAFYTFPAIAHTKLSSQAFCSALLKSQKLAVVPGAAFGRAGENHVRLSFASDLETLSIALERLGQFLKRI